MSHRAGPMGRKNYQGAPHMFGCDSRGGESCKSRGADDKRRGWKPEIGKEGVLNQFILKKYSNFVVVVQKAVEEATRKQIRDVNEWKKYKLGASVCRCKGAVLRLCHGAVLVRRARRPGLERAGGSSSGLTAVIHWETEG